MRAPSGRKGGNGCFSVVIPYKVNGNVLFGQVFKHETFLTEKIPEIVASSLVRGSNAASPQSLGNIAKILQNWIKSKLTA